MNRSAVATVFHNFDQPHSELPISGAYGFYDLHNPYLPSMACVVQALVPQLFSLFSRLGR